jgi:hypothetical protein
MRPRRYQLALTLCLFSCLQASAAIHYVDVNSTSPASPFTTWATAATNIQSAVDVSNPGDQIVVNDGVYQAGARVTSDGTTNRVVVTQPVTLQSVNGPAATLIDGGKMMRCAYLTNGAVLMGFTLTNGNAGNGGGLYCTSTNALISNCTVISNTATSGGGVYSGTLTNCNLSGNSCPVTGGNGAGATGSILNNCTLSANATGRAYPNSTGASSGGGASGCALNNCALSGNSSYGAGASGGGATACTLNNCTVTGNFADYGPGGAYNCAMTNCTISNNRSDYSGGGVTGGNLNNCVISGNNTGYGGGAYYGATLYNCTLSGNYASYGGGEEECTLINCLLTGNTAGGYGGGAYYGTLINCTVAGNTAQPTFGGYGGGAYNATLDNCIVYYNNGGSSGANDYSCTLNYCCTPTATGSGNISAAPSFDGNYGLQSGSPCIDAGTNAYVTTVLDLAGNLRIANGIVDIGAYEFQTANPLTVSVTASLTNVPVAYPVTLTGIFSKGQSDSWNFGDGAVVSNAFTVSHTWATAGDYTVVLTIFDTSNPAGTSASVTIHVKNQIIYYVNPASTTALAPYDSWNTAATNIQSAIDAALPVSRSLVLVTNGTYASGGRIVYGSLSNRVVINKPITVQSVKGPAVTIIQGNPVVGDAAARCVYLTNNAVLNGFTLIDGATRSAGDAIHENSGGAIWCEAATAAISNCVVSGNSAVFEGGGIYGGTIEYSTICSNSAVFAAGSGSGGGASSSVLNGCVLYRNFANSAGGGANNCTLDGCSLAANQAGLSGGGADSCTLNNCTLTGNRSATGGGANSCTLNNSIIYYNFSLNGPNYANGTLNYCSTTPSPGSGNGNTTAEPQLTDSAHISANSPCRGAGSTNYAFGTDIDGQPWLSPPSIGCDEYYGGAVTGPLSVSAQLDYTNLAAGFAANCAATIIGHAAVTVWNFGDGKTVTNEISVSHAWSAGGFYPVVLTAYNDSYPAGVNVTNTVHVVNNPVHYVSLGSTNPAAPYFSWATAASNIQDAVDVAFGGSTILVTNGVYQTGGRIVYGSLSNRVVINKATTLRSVNGPAVTVIQGFQVPGTTNDDSAVRCVYMTNNTGLVGFTLTGGATRAAGDLVLEQAGGGIFCESSSAMISNCVLLDNAASESAGGSYQGTFSGCFFSGNWALNGNWNGFDEAGGGGALKAILNNCVLSNNAVSGNTGGGASYCTLSNCTLVGNSAYYGGGAYNSTLGNCLLTGNTGRGNGGGVDGGSLTDCVLQYNSCWWGGGAANATLNNCLVITNSAGDLGGGAVSCQLNNCTLVGNSAATDSGGANASTMDNCIALDNTAPTGSNYNYSTLSFCCTMPDPGGLGNITNAPLWVDPAHGNFRLQSNSPCINSARNAFAAPGPDLDGNSRIVGGTVDIGPYEYQTPASVISYAWLQQYGLPANGSADFADPDGDGMNNYQEWIAGTNPTNAQSVLKLTSAIQTNNPPGTVVIWQSVSGITYFLQSSTNLWLRPAFSTIQSNIVGQVGTTSYMDYGATNNGPWFYRVGVQY